MGTRSALFAFAIRVGSAALLFGSQILLARWMGIHEFGIFTYCVMLMSVLGVVSSGGLLWATVKFLSEYVATENWAKFRRFLASARVTSVWTGALCLVIALGVINLVGDRISDALVLPLIIVLASLPIQTFNEFHEGVGKSQGWIGLSLAPAFIFRPILILAFLGFAKLLGYETDVLVLKFFVTPDQISIYYAAVRTISLIGFVYFAIAVAFGAKFSGAHATGDKAALQGFYRQAIHTFWPSLLLATGVLVLGKPILWLFGAEIMAGYSLMFLIATGLLTRAAFGPMQVVLSMCGWQKQCAVTLLITLAANVALNVMLIPLFGLTGTALDTMLCMFLESSALAWLAYSRLGILAVRPVF